MIDGPAFGSPLTMPKLAGPSGFAGGMFAASPMAPHGFDWRGALMALGSSMMGRQNPMAGNMLSMLAQQRLMQRQPQFGGGPNPDGSMSFGQPSFMNYGG